jgi:hypothetical protein
MFAEVARTLKRMASTVHHLPQSHQHKFFFSYAPTKIPQQHSHISQFCDQATEWKNKKLGWNPGRQGDYFLL